MFLVAAMDWIRVGEGWEKWIIKLIGFDLAYFLHNIVSVLLLLSSVS